jgi:hypothetical protein
MKTPGFTAENSFYRNGGYYRAGSSEGWSKSRKDSRVLPQQNFICSDYCQDCADHGDLSCLSCYYCLQEVVA